MQSIHILQHPLYIQSSPRKKKSFDINKTQQTESWTFTKIIKEKKIWFEEEEKEEENNDKNNNNKNNKYKY